MGAPYPVATFLEVSRNPPVVEELTDLARAQVAVRPESMRFPPCCRACGSPAAVLADVRFTRTLIASEAPRPEGDDRATPTRWAGSCKGP